MKKNIERMLILLSITIYFAFSHEIVLVASEEHKSEHEKQKKHEHDHHEREHDAIEFHDNHENHHKNESHDELEHGDHHDEHGSSSIGEGKAITKIEDKGNHFWLSEEAEKKLSLTSISLTRMKKKYFKIPNNSIVHFRDHAGVYLKVGGGYKYEDCKIIQKYKNNSLVQLKLKTQEIEVVTSGTALLRVAHLQATGQGGRGHVH